MRMRTSSCTTQADRPTNRVVPPVGWAVCGIWARVKAFETSRTRNVTASTRFLCGFGVGQAMPPGVTAPGFSVAVKQHTVRLPILHMVVGEGEVGAGREQWPFFRRWATRWPIAHDGLPGSTSLHHAPNPNADVLETRQNPVHEVPGFAVGSS